MNVLAIGCHPDDIEISCSGTLAKCVKRGDKVTVCHVCNGNMGHEIISPEELREIRINEAKKAGALAGIEVVTIDICDLLPNGCDFSQRDKIVELIKNTQPDFIITHSPNDYMPDHREVSKLVFNVSFSASCPHFYPELGAPSKVSCVYYADTDSGINFIPTEYVDVSDVIEQKIEMMNCHKSQLDWLQEHDGSDALAEARIRAAFWGHQCGVKYAEAFRPMLADGRMRTFRVLP